jgi:hypothetical protein
MLVQCELSKYSFTFKDLPKEGVKLEKRLDAWSSSFEGKGGMKVTKVLLHPGEVRIYALTFR